MLAAMDAFDTVFADGSVDCVVTAFLLDLIPEPRRLADEIHRILRDKGVWINHGPSGPLSAPAFRSNRERGFFRDDWVRRYQRRSVSRHASRR